MPINRRDLLAIGTAALIPPVRGSSAAEKAPQYDVAAYYWPAYHDEPLWRPYFPAGEGEWETIRKATPKFANQPRVPLWGFEDESDPQVMNRKLRAAAAYGVNVMIFDWYWYEGQPFLEKTLDEGYLAASNPGRVKFFLMWANHDARTLWDVKRSEKNELIWLGTVDSKNFEVIVDRVIHRYFKHPLYYKINGRPVFSVYDLSNLVTGLGGLTATKEALDYFRSKVKAAGFPGLHLQTILWGRVPTGGDAGIAGKLATQSDVVKYLALDSLTNYQWVHAVIANGDYVAWAEAATGHWEQWRKQFTIPYYPHVSTGWDSNPRFVTFHDHLITNPTPESFAAYLYKAKQYVDQYCTPKLITINSWNEWSEGSYLEPDTRWGFGYLEAVRKVMSGAWDLK
jgi:hypothetical protein